MFLCGTEDDCLLVRINLVQQLLHAMFVALLNLDSPVIEIRLRVSLFRVNFSAFHDVALLILIVINVARSCVHSERHQKTVLDALFQGISIDRVPKVGIGIGVVLSSRCGGHTQLISAVEILHQLSPLTFIVGTSTMALVDDNEVKEVTLILHVIGLLVICAFIRRIAILSLLHFGRCHHRLEDGEVKVASRGHLIVVLPQLLGGHSAHRIFRELVEVVDSLISENVSV